MERLRKKVFRKKEELHGKAIAFTVYEEDRWSEELGNWNWLKTGLLKKETEEMLMAAQDQVFKTNSIKGNVNKQQCFTPM